jgi:hypothetical protein
MDLPFLADSRLLPFPQATFVAWWFLKQPFFSSTIEVHEQDAHC